MANPAKLNSRERKQLAAAAALVGPDIQAYAWGRGNARMSNAAWGILIGFGIIFVVLLTQGIVLLPGWLVLLLLYINIKPYRGFALTPRGLSYLDVSKLNGKPNKVLNTLHPAVLYPPYTAATKGSAKVTVGEESITLKRRGYDRLAAAGQALAAAMPPAQPPPPPFQPAPASYPATPTS